MKKPIGIFIICLGFLNSRGQHSADYVQYMFNGLLINPAYAGAQEVLSVATTYGQQWAKLDASPVTKSFSIHSPLVKHSVNAGLSVEDETFGVYHRTRFSGVYAYRAAMGSGRLAMGISAGVNVSSNNWSQIRTTLPDDPQFVAGTREVSPVFGAGIYYDTQKFSAGFSVPSLFTKDLNRDAAVIAQGAYIFTINSSFSVRPSVMARYVKNSPLNISVCPAFYFCEKFGVAVGFANSSAIYSFLDIRVNDQLRFGYGYSQMTNRFSSYGGGTHELLFRYLFSYKLKGINSRFF